MLVDIMENQSLDRTVDRNIGNSTAEERKPSYLQKQIQNNQCDITSPSKVMLRVTFNRIIGKTE